MSAKTPSTSNSAMPILSVVFSLHARWNSLSLSLSPFSPRVKYFYSSLCGCFSRDSWNSEARRFRVSSDFYLLARWLERLFVDSCQWLRYQLYVTRSKLNVRRIKENYCFRRTSTNLRKVTMPAEISIVFRNDRLIFDGNIRERGRGKNCETIETL